MPISIHKNPELGSINFVVSPLTLILDL